MNAIIERFHDFVITPSGPKSIYSYRVVNKDGENLTRDNFRTQKAAVELAKAMGLKVSRTVKDPERSRTDIAQENVMERP